MAWFTPEETENLLRGLEEQPQQMRRHALPPRKYMGEKDVAATYNNIFQQKAKELNDPEFAKLNHFDIIKGKVKGDLDKASDVASSIVYGNEKVPSLFEGGEGQGSLTQRFHTLANTHAKQVGGGIGVRTRERPFAEFPNQDKMPMEEDISEENRLLPISEEQAQEYDERVAQRRSNAVRENIANLTPEQRARRASVGRENLANITPEQRAAGQVKRWEKIHSSPEIMERDKRIAELYQSGMSHQQIQERLGILSKDTIRNSLARQGLKTPREEVLASQRDRMKQIHDMYAQGVPIKEIKDKFGVSGMTVNNAVSYYRNLAKKEGRLEYLPNRRKGYQLIAPKLLEIGKGISEQGKRILGMIAEGKTRKEVSELVGVHPTAISKMIERLKTKNKLRRHPYHPKRYMSPRDVENSYNDEFRKRSLEHHESLSPEEQSINRPKLEAFNKLDHMNEIKKRVRGDRDKATDIAGSLLFGTDTKPPSLFTGYDPTNEDLNHRFLRLVKGGAIRSGVRSREQVFSSLPNAEEMPIEVVERNPSEEIEDEQEGRSTRPPRGQASKPLPLDPEDVEVMNEVQRERTGRKVSEGVKAAIAKDPEAWNQRLAIARTKITPASQVKQREGFKKAVEAAAEKKRNDPERIARNKKIIGEWRGGKTPDQLAEEYGTTKNHIYKIIVSTRKRNRQESAENARTKVDPEKSRELMKTINANRTPEERRESALRANKALVEKKLNDPVMAYRNQKIMDAVNSGKSLTQVAQEFGIWRTLVGRIVKRERAKQAANRGVE